MKGVISRNNVIRILKGIKKSVIKRRFKKNSDGLSNRAFHHRSSQGLQFVFQAGDEWKGAP